MAFQHFRRHTKLYMTIFFVATLFSLFTFNVTGAIVQFFASVMGGTSGAAMKFKTFDGREVGVPADEMTFATQQIAGLASFGFDMEIAKDRQSAWLPHVMLLADADSMGIQVPDEAVQHEIEGLKQKLSFLASLRDRGHVLTELEYRAMLGNARLTEDSLFERVRESMRIDAYVRSMMGPEVQDPKDVVERFQVRNELVTLEYVAFPFERFVDEFHKSPPADDVLETWFKALPAGVINSKYTRDERFSLDLATIDGDAFDAGKYEPELFAALQPLTDDEILKEGTRDPIRYAGGKAPTKAEEIDAAARAKIDSDRKLKIVVDKAKAEYEAAVNALPALPDPNQGVPTLGENPTDDEKKKVEEAKKAAAEAAAKATAERGEEEKKLFDQVAQKYSFTLKHVDDLDAKALDELDPPKSPMLHLLVRGLAGPVHSCSFLPSRDVHYAFFARVAERKAREPKPFAEVKAEVLEDWIEKHAKDKAVEAAKAFLDAVVTDGRGAGGPESLKCVDDERDRELKALDDEKDLGDEAKQQRRDAIHAGWIDNVQSVVGAQISRAFGTLAKGQGLEATRIGPQRRNVKETPYFRDRFSGAERHLWSQNGAESDRSPKLLGYASGMMSGVLVDDDGKACYVARVVERARPKIEEMSPSDRDQAERDNKQWLQRRSEVPYLNPFSYSALIQSHHPAYLQHQGSSGAPIGGSGY